jgi:hypothetical protein
MTLLDDGDDKIVPIGGGVQRRPPLNEALPWARRPNESTIAYATFTMYAEMGEGRSIRLVAEKCTKSEGLLRRWSARWDWVRRALMFDRYEARRIHERIIRRLATLRMRDLALADAIDEKTKLKLDTMTVEDVDGLSAMELCGLIRTSSDLKYKAIETSDGETVSFPGNLPAPTFMIQMVTPGCDADNNPRIAVQLEDGRAGYISPKFLEVVLRISSL